MRIGIAFDLKPKTPLPAGAPDDLHEEFDSQATVDSIANALRSLGHEPSELGNGRQLLERLLANPPELVFNFAEGQGTSRNREARVPAVCEMLGIPCTGSDVFTLAAALDKDITRRLVAEADVLIPKGFVLQSLAGATGADGRYDGDFAEFPAMISESDLQLPLIAKPVCEGSSKGIRSKCLIEKLEDVGPVVVSLWHDYRQPILIEEFIAGEEVTVGVIGNDPPQILGMMRVIPKKPTDRFVYSLEVKRDYENQVNYECPPNLPYKTLLALEDAALRAYDVLGCRDISRIDFRVRDGVPYFLEVNPLPGLNPITGDIVLIAKAMGMSHTELVGAIVDAAVKRIEC
ncbi:MAG: D-alanine--D-alanine ligase [Planctomycetes bacterium]|nr:D-alanine--D-alanine ligase [Planctomycetota bacterium]